MKGGFITRPSHFHNPKSLLAISLSDFAVLFSVIAVLFSVSAILVPILAVIFSVSAILFSVCAFQFCASLQPFSAFPPVVSVSAERYRLFAIGVSLFFVPRSLVDKGL